MLCTLLQVGGMSQPVDPLIIRKIYELVGEGVRKVSDMERHLNIYVKNELYKGRPLPGTLKIFTQELAEQYLAN